MDIDAYIDALDARCEPLLQNIQNHSVPGEVTCLTEYARDLRRRSDIAMRIMGQAKPATLAEHAKLVQQADQVEQALLVAVVCEEYADFAGRCLRCRP